MSTCPSCGTDNPPRQKFCGECGAKLAQAPTREERKVITALFCDLVGSTALGEKLDHEDVSRLLARYHELCRSRIESHGGVVEKFIGDAVVGVFGVPAAHEDDPERAVRAALAIVDDVAGSDLDLGVRIGVNTGEALVRLDTDPGQGFATGDTMNTAARLEAAAPVMGVVVGAATHRATRASIAYEELPPVAAKGKKEPVPAWKAIGPLPAGQAEAFDRTPFVGRDVELQGLIERVERAFASREAALITIVAEPGIGKSRLVRELRRRLETGSGPIAWRTGRCLPYGEGISFRALAEIVKAHARISDADDEAAASAKLDGVLADMHHGAQLRDRLAPLAGLPASSASYSQVENFAAWRLFLEQMATHPVAIVIEDLHWADSGFVAFLEHMAEHTRGVPLVLLVTARSEVMERHPSWPPAEADPPIVLAPLGDGYIEELLERALPGADREILNVVLERAGGSPLFAEQLASMWRDREVPPDVSAIPESVQALITARIDALAPESKRVLMEASVIGKRFSSEPIATFGEHPRLDMTLDDLIRRELIRPAGEGFSFWHALVRDVAYGQVTRQARARLHAATARWFQDQARVKPGTSAEIIVHHLDAALELAPAAPELDMRSLTDELATALTDAGIQARTSGRVASASALFWRAASLIPSDHRSRPELLRMLGGVARDAGDLERASSVLGEAVTLARMRGDTAAEWRAIAEKFDLDRIMGSVIGERPMIERWIPLLEADGDHLGLAKAWRLLTLVAWDESHFAESEGFTLRGVREARLAGAKAEAGEIAAALTLSDYEGPRPVDDGLRRGAKLLDEYADNARVTSFVLGWVASMHAVAGRFADAHTRLRRSAQVIEEAGLVRWAGFAPLMASLFAFLEGDLDRAMEAVHAVNESDASDVHCHFARVLANLGRADEALDLIRPEIERDECPYERAERFIVGSDAWRRLGDPVRASDFASRAIGYLSGSDDAHLVPEAWLNLGLAELDLHLAERATTHLVTAWEAYAAKGNLVMRRRVEDVLGLVT